MKWLVPYLTSCILFGSICVAEEVQDYRYDCALEQERVNPGVSDTVWEAVQPFLMPDNHPIKEKLDRMFSATRILHSDDTIEEAGFKSLRNSSNPNKVIVATHKKFPGYIFKMYSDMQSETREPMRWVKRCLGAIAVQNYILEKGYEKIFVVPQKWIYQVPNEPEAGFVERKYFILVAQDMDIFPSLMNRDLWKSKKMSKELLTKVFYVFRDVGLADSAYCFNVPFTKKGKLAFIDTEVYNRWPIPYFYLFKYLSKKNQKHWQMLIDTQAENTARAS